MASTTTTAVFLECSLYFIFHVFIMDIFTYAAKVEEFYSEHSYPAT